jgi:pseudaminic acid cytidylyltransferase
MNIAIIPARGGSKRIPRKNIKNFLGKPIIAYSIEVALDSKLFDKVIVSTDDKEIARISKEYGAEVPFFRPKELSGDFTGVNDVVKDTINWLLKHNTRVDYACCIFATAPFIEKKYLAEGFEELQNSNKSFALAVTSFAFPIQRAIKIKNNNMNMFYPEHFTTRSQDLEEAYHDAGSFCWGRSKAFLDNEVSFSERSIPILLPRHLVQDIDTLEDWRRAELMYQALGGVNEQI